MNRKLVEDTAELYERVYEARNKATGAKAAEAKKVTAESKKLLEEAAVQEAKACREYSADSSARLDADRPGQEPAAACTSRCTHTQLAFFRNKLQRFCFCFFLKKERRVKRNGHLV